MSSTIKRFLSTLLTDVIKNIALSREIILNESFPVDYNVRVEYPPGPNKGHYSTPVAMECAKIFKRSPNDIANEIVEKIKEVPEISEYFEKIEIANPGFINIFISTKVHIEMIQKFNQDSKSIYNLVKTKDHEKKIIFEFVSANPTGPLNIVSARAAAVGDAICRIIKICGYNIYREYYVNDYGNQVKLLGLSLVARYLQKKGHEASLPEEGYQGEYIKDVLEEILKKISLNSETDVKLLDKTVKTLDIVKNDDSQWKEKLGESFGTEAVEILRASHEKDLNAFGVYFDNFFSEKNLHDGGEVDKALKVLKKAQKVYEQDDATLFKSTDYGDEKDRVIVRSDGRPTYLLADIAYHKSKIDRGFTHIYDIWGPDHHGYIARLKGAMKAMGFPESDKEKKKEAFEVMIVQQVNMIEDGKPVVMSKRLGKFHTMTDLLEKIPADVVRYFFLMRSQSSHLDFDLDLAMNHSSKNPVYYIQYAHARICSIFREAKKDIDADIKISNLTSEQIKSSFREELLLMLWRFPEIVEQISINFEVQILSEYLYNMTSVFTRFYHEKENRILPLLETSPNEAEFLLKIIQITRQVIKEGLELLGISAPVKMEGLLKQQDEETI
ncbi:MAG: arginine--tRNA ligase [Spirochaetia bacterium]|nr:arginine--tRNA ligase [Spirochaetia bacterium]